MSKISLILMILFFAVKIDTLFADVAKRQGRIKNAEEVKQEITQNKYYLYDEATDAYIESIIKQALKIQKNGDPNEAIMLLIREQDRLDKLGRKVNLPSKEYVKGKNGVIWPKRKGEITTLPLADEKEIPRFPSPLVVTLMTIRMKNGQSPTEMLDYYKELAKNYKGNDNSIGAAKQVVMIMGIQNNKAWEFVDATFEQWEKDLLTMAFMQDYLNDRIQKEHLLISFKRLSPLKAPDGMLSEIASLGHQRQVAIDSLFWDECPDWIEFNVQNRFRMAMQLRNDKKYELAKKYYRDIAERYHENKDITYEAKILSFETDMESVFVAKQAYTSFETIVGSYQDLYDSENPMAVKANVLRAICKIYMGQDDVTAEIIKNRSLTSEDFVAFDHLLIKLSYNQRRILDEYFWKTCKEWNAYNFTRQYFHAVETYRMGKYADSVSAFELLFERNSDKASASHYLAYAKTLIRVEEIDKAGGLLQQHNDIDKLESILTPDIIWLLQNGKTKSVLKYAGLLKTLIGKKHLSVDMMYCFAYALLLEREDEKYNKIYQDMKRIYPKHVLTLKLSFLWEQKETLLSAVKYTERDQYNTLVSKASKCFDDGNLEMAMGVYLRILGEYADRTEDASKACYLLGYYYLLSGEFKKATDILVFLQTEYKYSPYTKEAELLINRIKDLTVS